MLSVIEGEETSKSLQTRDVNISLKRHEAIETDVKARVRERYVLILLSEVYRYPAFVNKSSEK